MGFVFCFLKLILLLQCICKSTGTVFWILRTHPVIFGEDLQLFCNTTQSECTNCTKLWYGGHARAAISYNEKTLDPGKYVVTNHRDGFDLTIKNLTEEDVQCSYSCSNSFDLFKKNLTLDDLFEFHPKNKTIKVNVTDGSVLHMVVEFKKVHPVPVCEANLDGKNLSHKLTMNKTKKGLVYCVTIELYHELKTQRGKFKFSCTIGTRTTMFVEQDLAFTYVKDQQTKDFTAEYVLGIIGAVIGICAIIITIVALYNYRTSICKKREYANCQKDEKIQSTVTPVIDSSDFDNFNTYIAINVKV